VPPLARAGPRDFFNRQKFSGLKFGSISGTRSSADFTGRPAAAAATWKSNKTLTPKKTGSGLLAAYKLGRG
jgi:hypothetical protein